MFATLTNAYAIVSIGASQNFYRLVSFVLELLEVYGKWDGSLCRKRGVGKGMIYGTER